MKLTGSQIYITVWIRNWCSQPSHDLFIKDLFIGKKFSKKNKDILNHLTLYMANANVYPKSHTSLISQGSWKLTEKLLCGLINNPLQLNFVLIFSVILFFIFYKHRYLYLGDNVNGTLLFLICCLFFLLVVLRWCILSSAAVCFCLFYRPRPLERMCHAACRFVLKAPEWFVSIATV